MQTPFPCRVVRQRRMKSYQNVAMWGWVGFPHKAIVAMCAGLHLGEKSSPAPDAKPGDKLINRPMLVVNGTRDAGNPVAELMSTYQATKEGDLWLLGRGEHCAVEYWPVVIPQMADWLTEKINK
jgi:hypothetical protein